MTEPKNIGTEFLPSKINQISIKDRTTNNSSTAHHINVSPDKFVLNYKFDNFNNDWLVNLMLVT